MQLKFVITDSWKAPFRLTHILLYPQSNLYINVLLQVLTNCLWYVTNQHEAINDRSRREKDVRPIPPSFDRFQGYNEHKRKQEAHGPRFAHLSDTATADMQSYVFQSYHRN